MTRRTVAVVGASPAGLRALVATRHRADTTTAVPAMNISRLRPELATAHRP